MKLKTIQETTAAIESKLNYLKKIQSHASYIQNLEKKYKIHTEIKFAKEHLNAWNASVELNGQDKSIYYYFYSNSTTFYSIRFPRQLVNIHLARFPSAKLLQTHKLFIEFLKSYPDLKGSFLISWHDIPKPKNNQNIVDQNQKFICFTCLKTDPLGLCIPDDFFLETQAYEQFRQQVKQQWLPWCERKPICYWRGASSGSLLTTENWQNNRRIRLCNLAKEYNDRQFIDAKITRLTPTKERGVKQLIRNANLVDNYIPTSEFIKYKYVIDIDGNSNSWPGLFTKLLTGSCVLKIESPWMQWYYNSLKPWVNYVPVKTDLSDLIEKISWCRQNDDKAREIGANGRELALSLTMETEIPKAYQTILEALGQQTALNLNRL